MLTATGATTAFDGFLRIWREDGEEGDTESARDRPLPAMAEGERAFVAEVAARAAPHAGAAPLQRGRPGAEAGGARHRPAVDLRRDRRRGCASGAMPCSTGAASCRPSAAES